MFGFIISTAQIILSIIGSFKYQSQDNGALICALEEGYDDVWIIEK